MRPLRLQTALAAGVLIIALVPLLVLGMVNLALMDSALRQGAEVRNQLLARAIRGELAARLAEPRSILRNLRTTLRAHLPHNNFDIDQMLQDTASDYPQFETILLLDATGTVVHLGLGAELREHYRDFAGLDMSRDPFLIEARSADGTRWSDTFLSPITGAMSLSVAEPMPPGVLVGSFRLEGLATLVEGHGANKALTIALFDRQGSLLYTSRRGPEPLRPNLANLAPVAAGLGGTEGTFRFDWEGESALGSVARLPQTGWLVLVLEPLELALQPVTRLRLTLLTALAATLILCALGAMLLGRRLSRPLAELGEGALALAHGREEVRLPAFGYQEVRSLAQCFDIMRQAIRQREQRLASTLAETEAMRDQLEAVLQSVDDPLIVADDSLTVLHLNRSAEALFGHTAATSIGQPLTRVCDDPRLLRRLGQVQEFPQAPPFEFSHIPPGATAPRLLLASSRPVHDLAGHPHGSVTCLRDVTRERQSDRLKSEFIAMAAHELRTPLTAVAGYAELLLENQRHPIVDGATVTEFLEQIVAKSEHLERIISELLDLGRIESGRPLSLERRRCDIAELLRDIVAEHQRETDRHHLQAELPERPVLLWLDPDRIEQAVDNLLANAVKYSPGGGTIALRGRVENGVFALSVRDPGLGIAPAQLPFIFDKFFRADSGNTAVAGLGLGLSITRSVIEAHGGRIWAESTPGQGSCFHVTLPLENGPDETVPSDF